MRRLTEETPAIVSLSEGKYLWCVLTPFNAWCASPEKEELVVVEMRLEELVMMPLENTYISFLQKNTCEQVFVQTTLLFSL